jgi:hypothetical protein
MTVKHDDLVALGADVKFWKRKVEELENAPDRYNLDGQVRIRAARQQLRQAQRALREIKRNVQMRLF